MRGDILSTVKGRVPIPHEFPGRFFVLEFSREGETFILTVDDEARSSFDLGSEIPQIQTLFKVRGFPPDRTNDLIDKAREFGAAQYIPRPGTHVPDDVIQLPPRAAKTRNQWSWAEIDEETSRAWNTI